MNTQNITIIAGAVGIAITGGLTAMYLKFRNRNENSSVTTTEVEPSDEPKVQDVPVESPVPPVLTIEYIQPDSAVAPEVKKERKKRTTITEEMKKKIYKFAETHTNKQVAEKFNLSQAATDNLLSKARKEGKCSAKRQDKQ